MDISNLQHTLDWQGCGTFLEARLGDPKAGDGVIFTLQHRPTCYRRGPYLLTIQVADGPGHIAWGCFDDQDQPMRNYHDPLVALSEAGLIAKVLVADRKAFKGEIG